MLHPRFVRPRYGEACFADVPHTIERLLTGRAEGGLAPDVLGDLQQPFRHVVCLFIDALGWRFVAPRMDAHPFLKAVSSRGVAAELTSQFPSTTAAHMTAFHTGLTPAQSGIYEWRYYEPELDAMICPLPFNFSGEHTPNTLAQTGIAPAALYPAHTFYKRLADAGVRSTAHLPEKIVGSPFSLHITQGAERRPFRTLSEGLVNVASQLREAKEPQYINLYYPGVDTICHRYGPQSPQVAAEIDMVLTAIDRCLLGPLRGKLLKDTLLMVTADHGQVEVSPDRTVYLNLDPRFQDLGDMIQTNRAGQKLVPGGSLRDMFLYIKPERLEEAAQMLSGGLEGVADVIETAKLVDEGFFGPAPGCPQFQTRLANLVVLPYRYEAVWWFEEGRFDNHYRGHHGGLTPEEMAIPLLACPLGD